MTEQPIDTSFFNNIRQARPVTEKQLDMIETLRSERGIPELTDEERKNLNREDASAEIDRLLSQPRKTTSKYKDVPAGRYALPKHTVKSDGPFSHKATITTEWKFYQVDTPTQGKWAGRVFLSALASDDRYPIRGTLYRDIMDAIMADPRKASIDYGKQVGECGICHKTLTNPDSIAAGIGPICANKMNW